MKKILEGLGTDMRILLKWILKKQNENANCIHVPQSIAIFIRSSIMILPIVADFFVVFFSPLRQPGAGYGLAVASSVTSVNTGFVPAGSDVAGTDNIVSC
jgi:hypothetical protein